MTITITWWAWAMISFIIGLALAVNSKDENSQDCIFFCFAGIALGILLGHFL